MPAKPAPRQERRPVDAGSARQPGIAGDLRLPVGQDQSPARTQDPAGLGSGGGRVGSEVERVDRNGGVSVPGRKPGTGEITNDELCPARQPEQRRPVRGLTDRNLREVHPYQRDTCFPGQPQSWTAATAPRSTNACPGERLRACTTWRSRPAETKENGSIWGARSGSASSQTRRIPGEAGAEKASSKSAADGARGLSVGGRSSWAGGIVSSPGSIGASTKAWHRQQAPARPCLRSESPEPLSDGVPLLVPLRVEGVRAAA
jgi:hypothetical protein